MMATSKQAAKKQQKSRSCLINLSYGNSILFAPLHALTPRPPPPLIHTPHTQAGTMSFTAEEWTEDYKSTKAFTISLRSSSSSRQQLANLEQSIDKLDYRLGMMEQNPRQYGMYVLEEGRREGGRKGGEGGSG